VSKTAKSREQAVEFLNHLRGFFEKTDTYHPILAPLSKLEKIEERPVELSLYRANGPEWTCCGDGAELDCALARRLSHLHETMTMSYIAFCPWTTS
jgi:hypothetical protein